MIQAWSDMGSRWRDSRFSIDRVKSIILCQFEIDMHEVMESTDSVPGRDVLGRQLEGSGRSAGSSGRIGGDSSTMLALPTRGTLSATGVDDTLLKPFSNYLQVLRER
jgi:hypothetical protein